MRWRRERRLWKIDKVRGRWSAMKRQIG